MCHPPLSTTPSSTFLHPFALVSPPFFPLVGWGKRENGFFPSSLPPRSDVSINAAPSFPPFPSLLSFIHYPCSPSLPLGYTAAPPFLHSKPIPPLIFSPAPIFPPLGRKSTIALKNVPCSVLCTYMVRTFLVNPNAIYRRFPPCAKCTE